MSFFVTSVGKGNGADLGGLAGADAHCQALAKAAGSTETIRASPANISLSRILTAQFAAAHSGQLRNAAAPPPAKGKTNNRARRADSAL